jgi:hypothetical protein
MLLAPLRLGTAHEHIYWLVEVQMVAGAAPFILYYQKLFIELITVAEKIEWDDKIESFMYKGTRQ